MFFFDPTYLLFMIPTFLLMIITSVYVKSAFNKWSKVPARSQMTGYEAVQRLNRAGRVVRNKDRRRAWEPDR